MAGAHCTGGGRFRPAAWLGEFLLLALLATAPAAAAATVQTAISAGGPQPGAHWKQIESRIDSGYFRQNADGLEALAATLSSGASAARRDRRDKEWRSYYAALLAYRLALLAQDDAARAWPFTQRCIDRLNDALGLDTASAEALALQSACLALQSHLDLWRSPLAAPRSLERIDEAFRLAPDNPRVLLLGAVGADERPRLFGGDSQEAFTLLERAVSAFEEHGAVAGVPGWGAADAFTSLAQDYLTRGDAIAARSVLERALLVAPDFTRARRLMAKIVSG